MLKDKWSPALQIRSVLHSLSILLDNPAPDDPLDTGIAEHYKTNPEGAQQTAREWTAKYANGSDIDPALFTRPMPA